MAQCLFWVLENKHRNYGRSDHCPDHEVHQGGIMILSGRVHDTLHIILRSELSSHLRSSAALTSLTCSPSLFPSQVDPAINSLFFCKLKELPGIISLIGCGIVQAHYAFKNISDKSETTIKYFIAMLRFVLWKIFLRLMTHFSSTMDCIIFLYLGMAVLEAVQVPLSLFEPSWNMETDFDKYYSE